jgi:glycosyltransferase involved in cell wall biosynthesis
MKVALVTFEFEGLTKSGGIGTAYRRMAVLLNRHGYQVTAVVAPLDRHNSDQIQTKNLKSEISSLKDQGISVAIVGVNEDPTLSMNSFQLRRSLDVFRYLQDKKFDIIHYTDNCALAYFSLLAKQSKLAFHHTQFVVGAHGSPLWTSKANRVLSGEAVLLDQIDRYCVEHADHLVSPSAYMLGYLKKEKWKLPKNSIVIPNVNHLQSKPTHQTTSSKIGSKKSLVFFGRLEFRKGILLFLGAIEKLLNSDRSLGVDSPLEILFMGREEPLRNGMTRLIRQKLNRFGKRVDFKFTSKLSARHGLDFLSRCPARLICMPSLVENSPYVLVESTELGFDFISTDSGGQKELLHPSDWPKVLISPSSEKLYRAIRARLQSEAIAVRPSRSAIRANRLWLDFHQRIKKKTNGKPRIVTPEPCVSIVLDARHLNKLPSIFKQLSEQDHPPFELLVPEGVSFVKTQSSRFKIRSFDPSVASSRWLSAAKTARGKYLLFLGQASLYNSTTLHSWVIAAEEWSRYNPKYLATSGAIVNTAKQVQWIFPNPTDPLLCLNGKNPGNIFALWNRSTFLKYSLRKVVDLDNETALSPTFSNAIASGFCFGTLPIPVVKTEQYDPIIKIHRDQLSTIEPFMKKAPKDWSRWLYYLASLQNEITRLKNAGKNNSAAPPARRSSPKLRRR